MATMEITTSPVREGDHGLHAPSAPIQFTQVAPPNDSTALEASTDRDDYTPPKQVTKGGGIFRALAWVIALLLGLYVIAQFADVVSDTLQLPPTIRWPVLALETIVLVLLVTLVIRGFVLYKSLPSFETIKFELRRDEPERAQDQLVALLTKIGDANEWANRCGFSAETGMACQLKRIVDLDFGDEEAWWEAYDDFEAKREARARTIIGHYSKMIGIKTAAAPWKIVDLAAVLYNSTRMMQDIVLLYNRRGISRSRAFRLVCHFALNIYVSGEIGDIASKIGTTAGQKAGEVAAEKLPSILGGHELPDSVSSIFSLGSGVLGKLAGKVAEGAVNALFAWRLGLRAIQEFRPIEPMTTK